MPELRTRYVHEDRLRAALLLLMESQQVAIVQNLSGAQWGEFSGSIQRTLAASLKAAFVEAADQLVAEQEAVIPAGDIDAAATGWSEAAAAEIAVALVQRLREVMDQYRDRDSLLLALLLWLGPDRADAIAVTEITRAITAGEAMVIDRINAGRASQAGGGEGAAGSGGLLVAAAGGLRRFWITARDDRVCPVCSPLHGKGEIAWKDAFPLGPPAHPRCRCALRYAREP